MSPESMARMQEAMRAAAGMTPAQPTQPAAIPPSEVDRVKRLLKNEMEVASVLYDALKLVLATEDLEVSIRNGPSAIVRAQEALARYQENRGH